MLGFPVSHRLRRLGPTTLPQPPPLPLQSALRVHGSAKTSTLASSAKSVNPVRRVGTVRIEASCSSSLDSRVVARVGVSMDKTRGVAHCGLAIYIKKVLNAKEEL
jgi:hypothetical protein